MKKIISALAGAFSTVKFPTLPKRKPTVSKNYTLTVHSQKPINEVETFLLFHLLSDYCVDPKVDSLTLADTLMAQLKSCTAGDSPNRQIHLVLPLATRNVKLTKRKPSYALKANERFLLANRSHNSYWVITTEKD